MSDTGAPACCTREYDVLAEDGRTFRMHADTPEDACRRAADLHACTIVAWRHPRTALLVGAIGNIIG